MATDKKRKQLLNRLKKREKKGIAKPIVAKPLAMNKGERNKFASKNAMVLLAIERTIVALADSQTSLDDRSVRDGLASSIRDYRSQGKPGHEGFMESSPAVVAADDSADAGLAQQLSGKLRKRYDSFFPANNSQTTETWVEGLRAIYTSVCGLSDFAPDESSYIQSARRFVANAQSD